MQGETGGVFRFKTFKGIIKIWQASSMNTTPRICHPPHFPLGMVNHGIRYISSATGGRFAACPPLRQISKLGTPANTGNKAVAMRSSENFNHFFMH
jgi:hypothetical protein